MLPLINRVRRRDRAVEDDDWIRAFLRDAQYGVVATESDGQPFINPLLFVYDEETNALYFHTGRAGRIFANIAANARVCFNACRMGDLIADTEAWRFDVAYDSVIVFGKATVLADAEQATRSLRLLLAKYFPDLRYGEDYAPIAPEQLARTAVYRLEIEAWSGKRSPG
jgi:nitroimidazol reductase NimA-like FMN-containing flavoprotein (pyridoxamine 5'-phosphate oxidase superfamily)